MDASAPDSSSGLPANAGHADSPAVRTRQFLRLAALFRQFEDFDGFRRGLEALLREHPEIAGACLEFFTSAPPPALLAGSFQPRQISLALPGSAFPGSHLRLSPRDSRRRLGPADLHLLGSLADLLGVLLEQSRRHHDSTRLSLVLAFLLDRMPVGACCLDPRGTLLFANQQAREWLDLDATGHSSALTVLQATPAGQTGPAGWQLRTSRRLLYVRESSLSLQDGAHRVFILFDLSRERDHFTDVVERETYRCQWKGRPLTLLALQAPRDGDKLLAALPVLAAELRDTGAAGTVDSQTLALLLPGQEEISAREWLRARLERLPALDLRLGAAALSAEPLEGGELLQRALLQLRPRSEFLRRALALFDPYPPILSSLQLLLAARFELHLLPSRPAALQALAARPFDALLLGLSSFHGSAELPLARAALARHPATRLVLLSEYPHLPPAFAQLLPSAHLLEKPFLLPALEQLLQSLW